MVVQFVNISNLSSMLPRHIGHWSPNFTSLSLQSPQKLACRHGIKIHVSLLCERHTEQIISMFVVCSSSTSERSDSLERYTACVLFQA